MVLLLAVSLHRPGTEGGATPWDEDQTAGGKSFAALLTSQVSVRRRYSWFSAPSGIKSTDLHLHPSVVERSSRTDLTPDSGLDRDSWQMPRGKAHIPRHKKT